MRITFFGGAGGVTGSRHLISANGSTVQLDCGMFQGHRRETDALNRMQFAAPRDVDAVVLGHAHIDHTGLLPRLTRYGYDGPVYGTFATRDLAGLMLRDSAFIQEKDAEFFNKRLRQRRSKTRGRNSDRLVRPLYTVDDAEDAICLFMGVGYHARFEPADCVSAVFIDAGHILGSALTVLDVAEGRRALRLLYAVDLGRRGLPILRDPQYAEGVDAMILEATYGNRDHDDVSHTESKLADVVKRTVERGGKIIVPAFSVERTQEFIYVLHLLEASGRVPSVPVYVDSPLSTDTTAVFKLHPECFDAETNALLRKREDPFGLKRITFIRDVADSKRLNALDGPAIIISASGMCEAGRILHHLANNAPDPRNTILVIGYMAEGTLGRRIVDRAPTIRVFGEFYPLAAEVAILNTFSAHAGRTDLIDYATATAKYGNLRRIFLVHGEPEATDALAATLREKLPKTKVYVPKRGESVEI